MMFGFGAMGLVMLLFWVGLIAAAVLLVRALFQKNPGGQKVGRGRKERTPREILDWRYARGEITREEYEMVQADLQT